ncbi:MAG: DinB family protein [bacterium]|nr:DinB family protein [Candidatus Kapabacteria bacterium]
MSFANPSYDSKGNAPAYVDALVALLGDRDPWDVQQSLLPRLRELIAGLDDQQLHHPEHPGKWSIAAVIQHLADTEMVYGYRIRLILGASQPIIQGYDQDEWARALSYDETPIVDAIAELEVFRNANLRMLRRLDAEQWDRYGIHSERGDESVRKIFALVAGHDLVHLAQIARIKGVVAG